MNGINRLWDFIKNNGGTIIILITLLTSIYTIGAKVEMFYNDVSELNSRVNKLEKKIDNISDDNKFFINYLENGIEQNIIKQAMKIKEDPDDIKEIDIIRALDDFKLLQNPSSSLKKDYELINRYYNNNY